MSRGLASGITSQLASGKFSMAHLIAIETNESPYSPSDEAGNYLYTDAPVDIQNKLDATVEKFLYRLGTTEQSNIGTMSEKTKYGVIQQFVEQVKVGFVCDKYQYDAYGGTADFGNVFPSGTTVTAIGDITYPSSGLSALSITFSEDALRSASRERVYYEGTSALSYTYKANGFLTGIGSISEGSNINTGSLSIRISSVNQTVVSDLLDNGHLNRKVKISRAFLDSDYQLITNAVFKVYSGRIDGLTLTDTGGTSMMEISVANHWADFERISGRQTNNSSQKHHFDGDLSMEFAPQTGKKLVWGDITAEEAEKL